MINIKQRRKMLGLTQQELAARIGVKKASSSAPRLVDGYATIWRN